MSANNIKRARPDHRIHDLIADRFSPYCFEPRAVEPEKLLSCLEAARWAPSSYNEQPWCFIVARRDQAEEFDQMVECLVEANRLWARNAGVLILTVVRKTFAGTGKPNRVAEHDIGLAAGNLTLQATALGLHVHQMEGINRSKCRSAYGIPATHEPLTAIAIGYEAQATENSKFAQRDRSPRSRKRLTEFVFVGNFGQPLGA